MTPSRAPRPAMRRLSVLTAVIVSFISLKTGSQPVPAAGEISVIQFDHRVADFLGRQIAAHVADLNSLHPPPDYVVGARTGGEFTWSTFMRAVASYSALSGETRLSGK